MLLKYNGLFQLIATFIAPIIVVGLTIWYQNRKTRKDAKTQVFLNLMAHRASFPITQVWVDSLNQIEVIYHDNKEVISAWRAYFESLHETDTKHGNSSTYQIELLAAMSKDLGFGNLKPTQIADFYSPKQFGNTLQTQNVIQEELIRVLKNSHSYSETKKE